MVTLSEIKQASKAKNWMVLRHLYDRIQTEGVDGLDDRAIPTLSMHVIEASVCRDLMMLPHTIASLEKGIHPYENEQWIENARSQAFQADMELRHIIKQLLCLRCKHKWYPNSGKTPHVCPKCKSPYWNKERRKYAKKIHTKGTT